MTDEQIAQTTLYGQRTGDVYVIPQWIVDSRAMRARMLPGLPDHLLLRLKLKLEEQCLTDAAVNAELERRNA